MIVERLAVFPPQQRGVTLLLLWLPAEEGSAVQGHTGSHIPPESAHVSAGFKQRGLGAPGLCAKTYLCYQWRLQTIDAFRGSAGYTPAARRRKAH